MNAAAHRASRERALLVDAIDAVDRLGCAQPLLCTGPTRVVHMQTCFRCQILFRARRIKALAEAPIVPSGQLPSFPAPGSRLS